MVGFPPFHTPKFDDFEQENPWLLGTSILGNPINMFDFYPCYLVKIPSLDNIVQRD